MSDGNGLKYTATVDKRFKAPGPQPNGLQAADDGLWVIDQTNLKVYQLDWDSGAVLHEFQTATEHSSGITLDGDGNVWIASTFQFEVVKYDPATGEELARFPDPGTGYNVFSPGIKSSSHGVEWRDGKIYLSAPPTQHLHVMDATTWEPIRALRLPGVRPHVHHPAAHSRRPSGCAPRGLSAVARQRADVVAGLLFDLALDQASGGTRRAACGSPTPPPAP